MFAFFWLAIFPMILGGILLMIFVFILKKEGKKPAKPESKRITPAKFINEVAQYSNVDNAEAEKIIEFVFSHFPGFDWRKNLPLVRDEKTYKGHEENTKKSEGKSENQKTQG
jgi:hypothetical protein